MWQKNATGDRIAHTVLHGLHDFILNMQLIQTEWDIAIFPQTLE